MTQYLTYNVIKTKLENEWNAGVIAVPGFEDGDLSHEDNKNTIIINILPAAAKFATTGVNTRDNINSFFKLRLNTENETNTGLYIDEVRRIINSKFTNGYRHIDAWIQDKTSDWFTYDVNGHEVLRDF